MSEVNTGSGAPNPSGGATGEPNSKTINFDDHKRALDDLMKFKKEAQDSRAKLDELLKERQKADEKKLAEAGEYQKLLQLKEQSISELAQKLKEREQNEESLRKTLFDSAKLNAVRERLPGQLKRPEYIGFIDVDKVVINPETNEIDKQSLDLVVSDFLKTHPDLIKTDPVRLPNGAPSSVVPVSVEQWQKLPLKEKKAKYAEAVNAFKNK